MTGEQSVEKKKVSEATKKEYRMLLAETNTLRFRCDQGHDFTMEQPEKKWVRCNKETNFYIPMDDEHGRHTAIRCPKCDAINGIRRVAPPFRVSSGFQHRPTALDVLKRSGNIVDDGYL